MIQSFSELKKESLESLQSMLLENTKALFELRMAQAGNAEGVETHRFKQCRQTIARIKTAIRQRQMEEK